MAIRTIHAEGVAVPATGLSRSPLTAFDPGLSWTRSMWVKYPAAPSNLFYYTNFQIGDTGGSWFVGSYAYVETSGPFTGLFVVDVEADNGSGLVAGQAAIPLGVWVYITVRYTAGSTTLDLMVNGVVQDSVISDLSGVSAVEYDRVAFDTEPTTNSLGFSFFGLGFWQDAHVDSDVLAQMTSSAPIILTDLIYFSQFWYWTQISDWTAVGATWAYEGTAAEFETATGPLERQPIKSCVLPVVSRTGTGVQTVTGVQDADGNDFIGRLAFVVATGSNLDTLGYQSGFNTGYVWEHGADDGVLGAASAEGDIERFSAKVASTGDATRYSLLDYQPDIFFGGNFQGYAYVSEFREGELDFTYDLNNRGGFGFMIVVLGGDDLIWDYAANMLSGVSATSGPPVGVLCYTAAYPMDDTPAATTAAGGAQASWGWATENGAASIAAFSVYNQSYNARGLFSDRLWTILGNGSVSGASSISAWGDASYTIANGFSTGVNRVAFSNCAANSVVTTLRTTPGNQTIELSIIPKWVKIATVGLPTSAVVDNTQAQLCVGWTDGTRQTCAWGGETSPAFPGFPTQGARFLASDAIIKTSAAGAQAGSTTFQVLVTVVSINRNTGTITLNVEETDGTPYELAIFALGDELEDTPPQPVYGTTTPSWTLNRFDQKIRMEGGNGNPPPREFGRPIDWVDDGKRWKLERFDISERPEERA